MPNLAKRGPTVNADFGANGGPMRLALLTSGGDSPGMNAAIRVVVKAGIARGFEVLGIHRGFAGLLEKDVEEMHLPSVGGISRFGGTILGSARIPFFKTPEGQSKARESIKALKLDALIIIGGNGSLAGAHALADGHPCAILGIPASIDNDVGHTDLCIGADTAVNTIVQACDRISDTARAHKRAFIVEVMGRKSGYLAMRSGIAADADAILFAERPFADAAPPSEDELVEKLREVLRHSFSEERDKKRVLIIKSEGVKVPTSRLVERLQIHLEEDAPGVEIRETILGHVVRGGSPSAIDRVMAQRLALAAVLGFEKGLHDVMLAWDSPGERGESTEDPSVRAIPLREVLEETERLLDGSSPVTRQRVTMLTRVADLMAF